MEQVHLKYAAWRALALTAGVLTSACAMEAGGVPEDEALASEDGVAVKSEAIINGDGVLNPDAEGYVGIWSSSTGAFSCSGTMLTNEWVLTAKHCTVTTGQASPTNYVYMQSASSPQSAWIVGNVAHPTLDVRLLRLDRAFRIGSYSQNFSRRLRRSALTVGTTLNAVGYGSYDFAQGGTGVARQSYNPVSVLDGNTYWMSPNARNQVPWKGDSGGASFDGSFLLSGVHSTASFLPWPFNTVTGMQDVSAHAFASWAVSTIQGFGKPYLAHGSECRAGQECHFGDVNGDGQDDLIRFNHDGTGDVYSALSNFTVGTPPTFRAATKAHEYFCVNGEDCRVGDINADGRDDIVVFTKTGPVYAARSTGAAFGGAYLAHGYFCVNGEHCELADVNGDARADLVTFTKSGPVYVALSNGSTFGASYLAHNAFCYGSEQCAVADINGDRRSDLVVFTKTGPVWTALSNGSTFGSSVRWHTYFCVGNEVCQAKDVSGDGRADIIAFTRNAAGNVWVALSSGATFGASAAWLGGFCTTGQQCRMGDINGDTKYDAIAATNDTTLLDVNVSLAHRSP